MNIGYARVSTEGQNLNLQLDALKAGGCEVVFEDQGMSGAVARRPGLTAALERCASGDVLVAWKLDRLGRSLLDLVGLVERLNARGIGLKVLTGAGASIDATTPEGRLFFAMFAAMAEFERELIRERTAAGMKAARRRGRHVGRPRKLDAAQLDMAAHLMASDRSQRDVAKALGVAVSTLRASMKQRAA